MRRDFERKEKSKPRPDYTDWLKSATRRRRIEPVRIGPMACCSIGPSLAWTPDRAATPHTAA